MLRHELERQRQGDVEARAAAEQARNKAEAEAHEANEARSQVLQALVREQELRAAAEEALAEVERDRWVDGWVGAGPGK